MSNLETNWETGRPIGWHRIKWTYDELWKAEPFYFKRSEYSRSKLAHARNRFILERDKGCVLCGSVENLKIDITNYHEDRGFDQPEDLQTLCGICYAFYHHQKQKKTSQKPTQKTP